MSTKVRLWLFALWRWRRRGEQNRCSLQYWFRPKSGCSTSERGSVYLCACVCVCVGGGGACCANLFSLVFTRPLQTCNDMHVNCWSRERIAVCSHQVSGCTEPTPALSRYLFHSKLHSYTLALCTLNHLVVLPLKCREMVIIASNVPKIFSLLS